MPHELIRECNLLDGISRLDKASVVASLVQLKEAVKLFAHIH